MTDHLARPATEQHALAVDDAFAARLTELDAAARAHTAADRPDNTTRAYAGDWQLWETFCASYDLPSSAGSVGTLTAFVQHLAEAGYAPSTVERRLYGVTVTLAREHGVELSRDDRRTIRQALSNEKRHQAESGQRRGRGKARALSVAELRTISQNLPSTVAGTRDRALLLVGFGMAARRSELASLQVGDVQPCDEGLCVQLRWSKTGEVAETQIPWGTSAVTCPVRAWQTYRAALEDTLARALADDEPAFRQVDRHGNVGGGLSAESVGTALARAGERAGVGRITGHSLRAGLATAARRAGHDVKAIARQGRWSEQSSTVYRYIRTVDGWEDNAVKGVGL